MDILEKMEKAGRMPTPPAQWTMAGWRVDGERDHARKGSERHCANCGASMGFIENRHYDRRDTCGARECEREARDEQAAERADAHEQLDRNNGW